MLPVDGIKLVVWMLITILEVVFTVFGSKLIDNEAREAGSRVTTEIDPESKAVVSIPIVAAKEEVVMAGDGFVTDPISRFTVPIKVSAESEFSKIISFVAVRTVHVAVVENPLSIMIKLHVSDPSKVN